MDMKADQVNTVNDFMQAMAMAMDSRDEEFAVAVDQRVQDWFVDDETRAAMNAMFDAVMRAFDNFA